MSYRPPRGQPKTEKHLGQLVARYAEAEGLALRRVRLRISAMAFVGALARVREEDSPERFLIKGGMACELRFQEKARATRDLDADVPRLARRAPRRPRRRLLRALLGLLVTYSEPEEVRETRSHRFEIRLRYQGRFWGTLRVEVSPPEGQAAAESEPVPALSVAEFGLTGPEFVTGLSLRYQIAQKLHACSEGFDDRENERAHDLIDLLLMDELIEDHGGVKKTCLDIFSVRGTHDWPSTLDVEPNWREVYPTFAAEPEFPITDVEEAVAAVQELIERIDALELHLDRVAGRDGLCPPGRAGEDDVTRQERHVRAAVAEDLVGREQEVPRVGRLTHLAVDARLQVEVVVVEAR